MAKQVRLQINGKTYIAKEGEFLLDVCRRNNIFIPTLCTHTLLSPFGACRMCIVEVEGMGTLPTSCTLPVSDGMVVRTDTEIVREARRNILEFILSEHPSGCLLCSHKRECYDVQECSVKLGITTGCRFCAKDGACELQNVVEKENLDALSVHSIYRNFPVEEEDPFFIRDYNLCILCGRCVRVCQEVRLTGAISFNLRGPFTKVGTAFEVSHIEAGCEFCGSCVDVCPTGALYERTRKFKKRPDKVIETVCPLCSYMCRIQVEEKDGDVFAVRYAGDMLCASGKFGLVGMFWARRTVKKPLVKKKGVLTETSIDESLNRAKELLKVPASQKALVLSPHLPVETIMYAFAFAKKMGVRKITTRFLRWKGEMYLPLLFDKKIDVRKYNPVFVFSMLPAPLEIEIKHLVRKGVKVYEFVPYDTFLSKHVRSFKILPSQIDVLIDVLLKGKKSRNWRNLRKEIGEKWLTEIMNEMFNGNPLVIFNVNDLHPVLIAHLVKKFKVDILPLTRFAGERALLEFASRMLPFEEVMLDKRVKVIYSVGEHYIPSKAKVILQTPFLPTSSDNVEVIIPSLSTFDTGGTYIDAFGRRKKVKKIMIPDYDGYTDIQLMNMLTETKLKADGFKGGKKKSLKSLENKKIKVKSVRVKKGSAISIDFPSEFMGFSFSSLRGFYKIHSGYAILCSSETASQFGLREGDEVTIKLDGMRVNREVKLDEGVKNGFFKFLPASYEITSYIKTILSGKLPTVEIKKDV